MRTYNELNSKLQSRLPLKYLVQSKENTVLAAPNDNRSRSRPSKVVVSIDNVPLRHRERVDLADRHRRVSFAVVDDYPGLWVDNAQILAASPAQVGSERILQLRVVKANLGVEIIVVFSRLQARPTSVLPMSVNTAEGLHGRGGGAGGHNGTLIASCVRMI